MNYSRFMLCPLALTLSQDDFAISGQVEIHVRGRLAFWEDMSSRIEESLTIMEDVDDSHIQRVAAEIQRELFRMV